VTADIDDHVVRALRAGASGFLLKDTPPEEIVRAIRLVASGDPMLSPTVTRQLIEHVVDQGAGVRRSEAKASLDRLSERERQVATASGRASPTRRLAASCS
jgi:DNA-binding NarL/FixJ family response regulator